MDRDGIPSLTGLRGIAALWVFTSHMVPLVTHVPGTFGDVVRQAGRGGFLGVDLFFVLSGFVLSYNYSRAQLHAHVRGWAAFLWKRLARIYPVHIAALVFALFCALSLEVLGLDYYDAPYLSGDGLLRSLLLIHGWSFPITGTWNVASWSISCEWAAYLAFPLIAACASHIRSELIGVLIVAMLFVALFIVIEQSPHGGTMAYGLPRIAAEFSAGVVLHRMWELRGGASVLWDRLALVALVTLIVGGNVLVSTGHKTLALSLLPALASLVVYGLARANGAFARMLSRPAWQYAGGVSYSFYMVHVLMIVWFCHLMLAFGTLNTPLKSLAGIVASFALTLGFAHYLYRRVEVPMRARMLGMLGRHAASRRSEGAFGERA